LREGSMWPTSLAMCAEVEARGMSMVYGVEIEAS
jgi:hypothetical protein